MHLGDYGSESSCRGSMDHHSFVSDLNEGILLSTFLLSMLHYLFILHFSLYLKVQCAFQVLLPTYNTLQASQEERSRSMLYNEGVQVGFYNLCFKGTSF
jgi:hypothetical protein